MGSVGYTSHEVDIQTRTILKVKFAPGLQNETVAGTGFSPIYGHLGVYLQVESLVRNSGMLSNGYLDGTPQESPILDFSSAFTPECEAGDTTCTQTVRITVYRPNYDFYCLYNGTGCPWSRVYDTHPWNGTLYVQTDRTDPL